ncbi:hypothetical protein Tco_1339820 [Tanacetum coccineum]
MEKYPLRLLLFFLSFIADLFPPCKLSRRLGLQLLTASSARVKIFLDLLNTLEELILNSESSFSWAFSAEHFFCWTGHASAEPSFSWTFHLLDILQLNLPSARHPSTGLSSTEHSLCWTSFQLDFPSAGQFILSLIYVQI